MLPHGLFTPALGKRQRADPQISDDDKRPKAEAASEVADTADCVVSPVPSKSASSINLVLSKIMGPTDGLSSKT